MKNELDLDNPIFVVYLNVDGMNPTRAQDLIENYKKFLKYILVLGITFFNERYFDFIFSMRDILILFFFILIDILKRLNHN